MFKQLRLNDRFSLFFFFISSFLSFLLLLLLKIQIQGGAYNNESIYWRSSHMITRRVKKTEWWLKCIRSDVRSCIKNIYDTQIDLVVHGSTCLLFSKRFGQRIVRKQVEYWSEKRKIRQSEDRKKRRESTLTW